LLTVLVQVLAALFTVAELAQWALVALL